MNLKSSLFYKIILSISTIFIGVYWFQRYDSINIFLFLGIFCFIISNFLSYKVIYYKFDFFVLLVYSIIFFILSYLLPFWLICLCLLLIFSYPIEIYLTNFNIRNIKLINSKPTLFYWFTTILLTLLSIITIFVYCCLARKSLFVIEDWFYLIIQTGFFITTCLFALKIVSTILKNETKLKIKHSLLFLCLNFITFWSFLFHNLYYYTEINSKNIFWLSVALRFYPLFLFLFIYYFIWLNVFLKNYEKILNKN